MVIPCEFNEKIKKVLQKNIGIFLKANIKAYPLKNTIQKWEKNDKQNR